MESWRLFIACAVSMIISCIVSILSRSGSTALLLAADECQKLVCSSILHNCFLVGGDGFDQLAAENGDIRGRINGDADAVILNCHDGDRDVFSDAD